MAQSKGARLKHPTGWFAAGREVAAALKVLSDGAFKVYIWLCLHADRSSGRLQVDQSAVANSLSKSRRSIVSYFEELRTQGVCGTEFAANQFGRGEVRICSAFWPYELLDSAVTTASEAGYMSHIQTLLKSRRCVVNSFTPADQKLARALFSDKVPIENVERAFLLGCARKYASWLSGHVSGPITSLSYFSTVIAEVGELEVSASYWRYLSKRVGDLEQAWMDKNASSGAGSSQNSALRPAR